MQGESSTTVRGLRRRWPRQLTTRQKEKGCKASTATHHVKTIDFETKHCDSSIISTSSVWHDAITRYIKQLPNEDQQSIISTKDDSALTAQSIKNLVSPLIAKHKDGAVIKLLMKFGPILQHIRSFATVVDVAVQSHPNVACLIWGGVRLILEVNLTAEYYHESLTIMYSLLFRYHLGRLSFWWRYRSCSKDCHRTCAYSRYGQVYFLKQITKSCQSA